MSDEERSEPTNEQLAKFMVVLASSTPGAEGLDVNAAVLERIFDANPLYRMVALRKHEAFVAELDRLHEKMERGQLQCDHIRPNGKKCPNFNEPGSFYCGLHKAENETPE